MQAGTLLVTLRPTQVMAELAGSVGRESYSGMIFWWFNSALVGTFDRDTFVITYRSRGVKSLLPRLSGTVRPIPGGTQIQYAVDSNMTMNMALTGVIGMVIVGIFALALAAPYMDMKSAPGNMPPAGGRSARPAAAPLPLQKGIEVIGIALVFLGGAVAINYFVTRARTRALAAFLPQMFMGALILDAVAADDGIADVLPVTQPGRSGQ